jgi:hypothetical protein
MLLLPGEVLIPLSHLCTHVWSSPTAAMPEATVSTHPSLLYPWEGRSRAGFSEILMALCMAANRPFPPSPRRAGPKHSGRLMSSLTTTLAFSSTLSPGEERCPFPPFWKDDQPQKWLLADEQRAVSQSSTFRSWGDSSERKVSVGTLASAYLMMKICLLED